MKVLLTQEVIAAYRIPIFNALVEKLGWDLTILHAGVPVSKDLRLFKEICMQEKKRKLTLVSDLNIYCQDYDVLIAMFDVRWFTLIRQLLRKDRTAPIVLWGHGFGRSRKAKLLKGIRAYLMNKADACLFYDHVSAQQVINEGGLMPSNAFVAPNTLLVENAEYNPQISRSSFLYCGRLQERKKIDLALTAYSQLDGVLKKNIKFEIVGDGPIRSALEGLVKSLGIAEHVIFHGAIRDGQRLKPIFQRSLAYVSPGPVGLGVLHSFAYGVPVVTAKLKTHGPEATNLVDGVNCLLSNKKNKSIKSCLRKLAETNELSYSLGYQGYQLYTSERTIENMVNGFKKAVNYACKIDAED